MISGGVSFDGDPAKARAALVEALHCAHIVRATKSRLGLRDLSKQFDLAGGGVVWITDNEFVHHIYIDVRDAPVRPPTTEEPVGQDYYSINPAVLFASADFPNGAKPEIPATSTTPKEPAVPANYDATPSGSLWKNPPFAAGKDLKFKHGKFKLSDAADPGNAFPGILDWSDRRSPEEAEHYGIVLSWWPAPYERGVRYAIPSYYYATWENPSPTRLQDLYYGQPFLDQLGDDTLGLIWANGVPVVQTGFTEIYAAFLKTEMVNNKKKSFLWVATEDPSGGIYLRKYEFPKKIVKGMPVLAPGEFADAKLLQIPSSPVGDLPAYGSYNGYSNFDLEFLSANSSGTKLITILWEQYNGGPYPFPVFNNTPWFFQLFKIVELNVDTGAATLVKKFPEPRPPQTDVGNVTVARKNEEYVYSGAYFQSAPPPPWGNTGAAPPPPYSYDYEYWTINPAAGYYNLDWHVDIPAFSFDTTKTSILGLDYVVDTPTYAYAIEVRTFNRFKEGRFPNRVLNGASGGGKTVQVVPNFASSYIRYDNVVQNYTVNATCNWTEHVTDYGPTQIYMFLGLGATETLVHQETKGTTRTVQTTGAWSYDRAYSTTTNGANVPAYGQSQTSVGNYSIDAEYETVNSASGINATADVFLVASDLRVGLATFDIFWDLEESNSIQTYSRTYNEVGSFSYVNGTGPATNNRTYVVTVQASGGSSSVIFRRVSTHASFAIPEQLIEQIVFDPYSATDTSTNSDVSYDTISFMSQPILQQYPAAYSGYYFPQYRNVIFIAPPTSGSAGTTVPTYVPETFEVARGVVFSPDTIYTLADCFTASGATSSFDNKLVFAWAVTRTPYDLSQSAYYLTPDNTQLVSKLFLASNPSISVDLTNPDFHPAGFTGPGLTEKLRGAVQFLLLGPIEDPGGSLPTKPTTLSSE